MLRMVNLHVIEFTNESFTLSPPLRVAIERDRRLRLPRELEQRAISTLADSLSIRLGEGTAPVVLINATVLVSLQSEGVMSEIASAFLLPSHHVWMAKKSYDNRRWDECIRFAKRAVDGRDRLSMDGVVGACRFMCLASARIGDQTTFSEGIGFLESMASDIWAKSNVAFLKGFNARLKGHLPLAEELFRRAYELSPGNFASGRELASVCLDRGNLEEAATFAREALQIAQRNPYLVDILVAVLIRKSIVSAGNQAELDDMLQLLEEVGEQDGRSFYTTRRAEYEFMQGNDIEALRLVERAVKKTPTLFEPHRLNAEILLKLGNKVKARKVLEVMREMVNSMKQNDRRRNYRQYLETYAHYLTEVKQFKEAKQVFHDQRVFTLEESEREIRDIEILQAHIKARGL